MKKLVAWDTSALIALYRRKHLEKLNKYFNESNNYICVITEGVLFEFYDLLSVSSNNNHEFSEHLKLKEEKYESFFEKYPVYLINPIHDLAKNEIKIKGKQKENAFIGRICKSEFTLSSPFFSQEIQQIAKNKNNNKKEFYENSTGARRIDQDTTNKLKDIVQSIYQKFLNIEYTINIPVPTSNHSELDLRYKKFFDDKKLLPKKAYTTARTILKESGNNLEIIIISNTEAKLLSKNEIHTVTRNYKNLINDLPCMAGLLIWNAVNSEKIKYKNSEKSLSEILNQNFALDIEILLNSLCIADEFITLDQGQEGYAKIIFPDCLAPVLNKKVLLIK